MRVAALYDIHGNLPALDAVLADDIEAAAARMRAAGFDDLDELMLRESLLEPVGATFVARHFEERANR
jgi:hypothetical protein